MEMISISLEFVNCFWVFLYILYKICSMSLADTKIFYLLFHARFPSRQKENLVFVPWLLLSTEISPFRLDLTKLSTSFSPRPLPGLRTAFSSNPQPSSLTVIQAYYSPPSIVSRIVPVSRSPKAYFMLFWISSLTISATVEATLAGNSRSSPSTLA